MHTYTCRQTSGLDYEQAEATQIATWFTLDTPRLPVLREAARRQCGSQFALRAPQNVYGCYVVLQAMKSRSSTSTTVSRLVFLHTGFWPQHLLQTRINETTLHQLDLSQLQYKTLSISIHYQRQSTKLITNTSV
jgi:hypothetical protein